MKNKILVITDDKRNIEFSILNSFYQGVILLKDDIEIENDKVDYFNDIKLVVIDLTSTSNIKSIISRINTNAQAMSFLIIQSFNANHNHDFISDHKGFGQVRILNYREAYPEVLIEYVNQLMFPEFPVGASDVAIILPVYNEESRFQNVVNFYDKIETLCNETAINASVYFVNDGSKDRTQELVNEIIKKQREKSITVSNTPFANSQNLTMNTRKAGTYIEGIKSIRADVLLFVDADDSFQIEDMAKMVNLVKEGYYDLVVGTKDLTAENRPLIRRTMSFVKRQMTKSLLPHGVYDSQTGLKVIKGSAAKYIFPHLNVSTGLAIDLEILYVAKKYKFRTLQLPVHCIDQEGSHINIVNDSIQFIKNIFLIKSRHKNFKIGKEV